MLEEDIAQYDTILHILTVVKCVILCETLYIVRCNSR